MKYCFLFLAIITTNIVNAQKIPDPKPFANSITEDGLKKHLYTVASADFEGRETATEGQRKAAAYIESTFKSLGLQPGNNGNYQLNYPVYQDSLANESIEINGQVFQPNDDFAANISSNFTSTLFSGDIVFVGYGISDSARDDYKGLDVKGKTVLVLDGVPSGYLVAAANRRIFNAYGKQDAAQKNGAIAVLIIQKNFPRKDVSHTGNMYLSAYKKVIRPNTFYISEKIAKAITGDDYAAISGGTAQPKTYSAKVKLQFDKQTTQLPKQRCAWFY